MTFRLKAASGPLTGQSFELGDDTAVGSAAGADIVVEDLLEQHARIVYDGDVLMLEAVESTFVNGEPVTRQPLKSGDEIRFGGQRFVLQAPGLRPPSVLRDTEPERTNPWAWVAVGLVAAGGAAALAWFLLSGPN
jgi:pSer/pThr/pTyr-binding forkhead associated (FHA) protein